MTSKSEMARKKIAKYKKLINKERKKLHTRHCWHKLNASFKTKSGNTRYSCCGCGKYKIEAKKK